MEMPVGGELNEPSPKVGCSAIQKEEADEEEEEEAEEKETNKNSLRQRSAADRLLRLRFRIPLRAWVFASYVGCVLCRWRSLG